MALADYRNDMEGCSRCSSCKWVPYNQIKSWRFAKNCPSIVRYNFHSYSGSGRMTTALSTLLGRSELNDDVTDMIYQCQMCGACDAACKVYRDDIDLTEVLLELRAHCVESGQLVIEHMGMLDALKA
jgi:L-lactate utilization protein LutB